ncbi:MAG: 16S rRNA (cytidine(1402)-2'-O)-methyltransferase [Acidimicrobiia bacterium]
MSEPRLIVAATPIGNLGDISERLRTSLLEADVVYAEDTRRTAKLLAHVGTSPRVRSLFVGNENSRSVELVEDVAAGLKVVLVSDAGMPTVSDPGIEAVRAVRRAGYGVTVIPGPSAVTMAVALSGFDASRFVFEGFLPRKGKARKLRLAAIAADGRPVVLFVSPHRLLDDLSDLHEVLEPERQVAIAREMTKLHEELWTGTIEEALDHWTGPIKGELTVVIDAAPPATFSEAEAIEMALEIVENGSSPSDAARKIADSTGVAKRVIYQALLDSQASS